MFTLDTNILIAYLGGENAIVGHIQKWKRAGGALFISSITECEILSYPNLSTTEETRIERFLQENFTAIPFDGRMARKAALIRRNVSSLKLPDAAIAALALETNTPLVTRNVRDFRKIPGIMVQRT